MKIWYGRLLSYFLKINFKDVRISNKDNDILIICIYVDHGIEKFISISHWQVKNLNYILIWHEKFRFPPFFSSIYQGDDGILLSQKNKS